MFRPFKKLIILAAAATLMPAALMANPTETDRAQFEKMWSEMTKDGQPFPISKKLAWIQYEWTQGQFSLGYCSKFIQADDAETMRRIPNEADLMKSEAGRAFLLGADESFRSGMAYRSELPPTKVLCEKELKGRGETLDALSRELTADPK